MLHLILRTLEVFAIVRIACMALYAVVATIGYVLKIYLMRHLALSRRFPYLILSYINTTKKSSSSYRLKPQERPANEQHRTDHPRSSASKEGRQGRDRHAKASRYDVG